MKKKTRGRSRVWPLADQVYERSDDVLWTIAPPGVLLHNFVRREYIELDAIGYRIWGFVDGARPATQVVSRSIKGSRASIRSRRKALKIVELLAAHEFITKSLPREVAV